MGRRNDSTTRRRTGRRIGYVISIAVNAAMLVIATNLLDWGWFPWLTDDLDDVLPVLQASLIASIVANAVYLRYDAPWFKGITEMGLLTISLIVTIRLLQVFPFDFSAYEFGWATLVRWMLGLAIFGIVAGMLAQVVQLAGSAAHKGAEGSSPPGSPGDHRST